MQSNDPSCDGGHLWPGNPPWSSRLLPSAHLNESYTFFIGRDFSANINTVPWWIKRIIYKRKCVGRKLQGLVHLATREEHFTVEYWVILQNHLTLQQQTASVKALQPSCLQGNNMAFSSVLLSGLMAWMLATTVSASTMQGQSLQSDQASQNG